MGVSGMFVSWALLLMIIFPLALIGLLVFFLARKKDISPEDTTAKSAVIIHEQEVDPAEKDRILAMVEGGKISPEEGDELIEALRASSKTVKCPYCAEEVSPRQRKCPECDSTIMLEGEVQKAPAQSQRVPSGKISLFLAYYMLIIGIIVFSLYWPHHHKALIFALPMKLMALMAVISAILILKKNIIGWYLGAAWSALQIILLYTSYTCINKQFFVLQINFLTNGNGLGLNFVGIILLILFIAAWKEWSTKTQDYCKDVTSEYEVENGSPHQASYQSRKSGNKGCLIISLIVCVVLLLVFILLSLLLGVRTTQVGRSPFDHVNRPVGLIP